MEIKKIVKIKPKCDENHANQDVQNVMKIKPKSGENHENPPKK